MKRESQLLWFQSYLSRYFCDLELFLWTKQSVKGISPIVAIISNEPKNVDFCQNLNLSFLFFIT